MGPLAKLHGASSAKTEADDVLLLHALFCIAAADGSIEDSEDALIRAYTNTLPEFRDMDGPAFDKAMNASVQIAQAYNRDMKASLVVLAEIKSDAVRKKAFVLAVDIAMSSGSVDEAEEEMLDAMHRILEIDESLAAKIFEIVALKYLT